MSIVWDRAAEASVWDVTRALGRKLAYTTVMTTLDRLYKKGLLARRREGRAFLYRARYGEAELATAAGAGLVGELLGRLDAGPLLASLVDAVSDHDRALLDDLERLVKKRKRALGKEKS